jgi:hypothetical protein
MDITELTKWVVNRGDDLYSLDKQVQFKNKIEKYIEAINYTRCCETLIKKKFDEGYNKGYNDAMKGNNYEY